MVRQTLNEMSRFSNPPEVIPLSKPPTYLNNRLLMANIPYNVAVLSNIDCISVGVWEWAYVIYVCMCVCVCVGVCVCVCANVSVYNMIYIYVCVCINMNIYNNFIGTIDLVLLFRFFSIFLHTNSKFHLKSPVKILSSL